jgi:hypothetical protein
MSEVGLLAVLALTGQHNRACLGATAAAARQRLQLRIAVASSTCA